MSYQKILVAIDGTPHSFKVIHKATELADQLKAELAIVYVVDKSKVIGEIDANIYPEEALFSLRKKVKETLQEITKTEDKETIVQFSPEGHPGKEIISTAKSWSADLIILGSHGKNELETIILGSVALYVTRNSIIPVLVVPIRDKD